MSYQWLTETPRTIRRFEPSSYDQADLTPEQVSIMTQFVRSGVMSEDQYIKDIAKMQE